MAQLDRFLNILVSNNATALVLSEGDVATVTIKDSARPVMKQALTSAQILTLVREIAPSEKPHSLDAQGSVLRVYDCRWNVRRRVDPEWQDLRADRAEERRDQRSASSVEWKPAQG